MAWRAAACRPFFAAALMALGLVSPAQGAERFYLEVDSFAHSEPVPIRAYFNDWRGDSRHGGDTALSYNWWEAGMEDGPWRLGVLYRYDYTLRFSSDTAELYHRIQNKSPLPPGRRYALAITVQHYAVRGLRLAHGWRPRGGLEIQWGLSYLQGRRVLDGNLSGWAEAVSDKDYDFRFEVDDVYSRDPLFKRRVSAPEGEGYSVDLALNWLAAPWELRFKVVDLIGALYWKAVPHTRATGTSDTKRLDESGYVRFDPALSGIEDRRDQVQRLRPRTKVDVRYALNRRHRAALALLATRWQRFVRAGWVVGTPRAGQWQVLYDVSARALALSHESPRWRWSVIADDVRAHYARTFGISAQYVWRW